MTSEELMELLHTKKTLQDMKDESWVTPADEHRLDGCIKRINDFINESCREPALMG